MASYLKPRRGTRAQATAQLTGANKLKSGEIFFEVPDTGVGKGEGKLFMGDGETDYGSLTPFINPSLYMRTDSTYGITTDSSTTVDAALNGLSGTNTIQKAKGYIHKAISLLQTRVHNNETAITKLNNDLDTKANTTDLANKADITHNHTTAQITNFDNRVKAVKVNNSATSDYSTNSSTSNYSKATASHNHAIMTNSTTVSLIPGTPPKLNTVYYDSNYKLISFIPFETDVGHITSLTSNLGYASIYVVGDSTKTLKGLIVVARI